MTVVLSVGWKWHVYRFLCRNLLKSDDPVDDPYDLYDNSDDVAETVLDCVISLAVALLPVSTPSGSQQLFAQ